MLNHIYILKPLITRIIKIFYFITFFNKYSASHCVIIKETFDERKLTFVRLCLIHKSSCEKEQRIFDQYSKKGRQRTNEKRRGIEETSKVKKSASLKAPWVVYVVVSVETRKLSLCRTG